MEGTWGLLTKRIPCLKVGRLIRFDAVEIVEWPDSTRQPKKLAPQVPDAVYRSSGLSVH